MFTKKPSKFSKVNYIRYNLPALACIIGGAFTLHFLCSWSLFPFPTSPKTNGVSQTTTQENALSAYKVKGAIDFLKKHAPDIDLSTDAGKKRLELIIDKYVNEGPSEDLILLYEYFPEQFEFKELASIALAKALLAAKQGDSYYPIRQKWQAHEREPEEWFFLDAESLVIEGKFDQAASFLASRSFKNEAEKERLVRLALLHVVENPKLAWKYLSDASHKNPEDPTLNIYKAGLLESSDKIEPALNEYILAIQKDSGNPHLREQLADFYLRTGQYRSALHILEDSLAAPSLDSIWLKALFWSRLISPINSLIESRDVPKGDLEPLVKYIIALPPGIFWNNETFSALPNKTNFLSNRQETFWLRLIGELKNGHEDAAAELLQNNPFKELSWMPKLEKSMNTILAYRKHFLQNRATPNALVPQSIASTSGKNDCKSLLDTLETCSNAPLSQAASLDLPKDIQELVLSKEAFSLLFLAAGCYEAALQLHTLAVIPPSFPDWISYRLAEAIHSNRSSPQALQFILNQSPTPELALMTAELLLEANQSDAAIEKLKTVYKKNGTAGQKAAALLSKIYYDKGDLNSAKETILSQPTLANETPTIELLARIALQNGEMNAAYALYLSIESQSYEAKSFLARKAFADKEWPRAKKLTHELLSQYPDSDILKDNLLKIAIEVQKEHNNKKH